MDDGSEDEFGPGEVSLLPPGHDAWVVGNKTGLENKSEGRLTDGAECA